MTSREIWIGKLGDIGGKYDQSGSLFAESGQSLIGWPGAILECILRGLCMLKFTLVSNITRNNKSSILLLDLQRIWTNFLKWLHNLFPACPWVSIPLPCRVSSNRELRRGCWPIGAGDDVPALPLIATALLEVKPDSEELQGGLECCSFFLN